MSSHAHRCIVFLILVLSTTASRAAELPLHGRWDAHPAVTAFEVDTSTLPNRLYLLRAPAELPLLPGITIHARRGDTYLASGPAGAFRTLRQCSVYPLSPMTARAGERRVAAPRTVGEEPDPQIAGMVEQVRWGRIRDVVAWLVDFGTRYSLAGNHHDVSEAIRSRFEDLGLVSVIREYDFMGTPLCNVEATQVGTTRPDQYVIICGHFDSLSERPRLLAPGADDNGSGMAAVVTAAEILSQYDFEYSIRYIGFSGEEQMMQGSNAYAAWAAANGMQIVAALNFDMIGWWQDDVTRDLEIEVNEDSEWLGRIIVDAADLYTNAPYELHVFNGAWWGDHASFWHEGYAAANHEESWDWGDADFNPFYHTTDDLLKYIHRSFMTDNVEVAVASLATLARPVPPVVPVAFDIRPGSDVAPFNPKSRGVVPAVIYGDASVDVRDVDCATLRVGPAAPMATRLCDASGDGIMDLWMKLPAEAIAAAIGRAAKQDRITLKLTGAMTDGTRIEGEDIVTIVGNTGGPVLADGSPEVTRLLGAVPNPFNPVTRIRFTLARETYVRVTIYDARGHFVARPVDSVRPAGPNQAVWNAAGHASGIYFCHFEANGSSETQKLVLMK